VTVHDRDETILGVIALRGADVIVHDLSVWSKPVPVTVMVVPGVEPSAGEPLVGVTVTNGVTLNVVGVATSPELPVTVSVYVTPPGALPETVKNVPTREPVESIAHTDEAIRPVGLETKDLHAPTSDVENGFTVMREILWPA
jgi:hypothetical protein